MKGQGQPNSNVASASCAKVGEGPAQTHLTWPRGDVDAPLSGSPQPQTW